MQGLFILLLLLWCNLLTIFTNGQELLFPWERAAKLMDDFRKLPLREYGKQCANPDLLKNEYLEKLLKVPMDDLKDYMVVETMMVYNRWDKYGGYRCEPSKYECRQISDGEIWTCQCPITIGSQKTTEVMDNNNVVTGCKFDSNPKYSIKMTPNKDACANMNAQYSTPYPESYDNEIVCGIYKEDNITVDYNKSVITSIESGLHFNKIECPAGEKCLMKEFNSECTATNLQTLRNKWIYSPTLNRLNRLQEWPPCTCSSKAAKPFPNEDPGEAAIDKLFASLPAAQHTDSCDTKDLDALKNCARANYYLFAQTQLDEFKKLYEFYKNTNGATNCDTKKGLICSNAKCICDATPLLPGWSPDYPTTVNKNGYCLLNHGSDCTLVPNDPGYFFQCPDGTHCLIDRYHVPCTEDFLYQVEMRHEEYVNRCYCSAEEVQTTVRNSTKKSMSVRVTFKKSIMFTSIMVTIVLT